MIPQANPAWMRMLRPAFFDELGLEVGEAGFPVVGGLKAELLGVAVAVFDAATDPMPVVSRSAGAEEVT